VRGENRGGSKIPAPTPGRKYTTVRSDQVFRKKRRNLAISSLIKSLVCEWGGFQQVRALRKDNRIADTAITTGEPESRRERMRVLQSYPSTRFCWGLLQEGTSGKCRALPDLSIRGRVQETEEGRSTGVVTS